MKNELFENCTLSFDGVEEVDALICKSCGVELYADFDPMNPNFHNENCILNNSDN